jgi:hypothetical protein
MGQPGPTQVETGQLRAIGVTVDAVAEALAGAHQRHAADLVPAAAAGWGCVPVARSASAAWSGFIASLSESVNRTGGDLRAAADDYQASDRAARDRVGRAGRWAE